MDPDQIARLAGTYRSKSVNIGELPDEARKMAMLAGLIPAEGGTIVTPRLVPDEGSYVAESTSGLATDAFDAHNDFLNAMTRAAGISRNVLEEDLVLDADMVPPPTIAAPAPQRMEIAEDADPIRAQQASNVAAMVGNSVPVWAWELYDACDGIMKGTLKAPEFMSKAKAAMAKAPPRDVVESAQVEEPDNFWKSYFKEALR